MADPRNELADIIVPAAPEIVATGSSLPGWVPLVGILCVALAAVAVWLWHRRRPARALRRMAAAVADRQDGVPALAARLDAWARVRYGLPRMDAASCPSGVESDAWADWAKTLTQLRFAAPQPGGFAALARLCEAARAWERHV